MGISHFWLEIRHSRIYDIIVVFRVQGGVGISLMFLVDKWEIPDSLFWQG